MKKIAVLGGGQVGASVAKILTDDGNDITLVDNNVSVLEDLQEDNDIKTIQGNASSPSVLNQVELSDCDILIATTASDEVNLVSCHLAKKMFNVPNVIARLRNAEYREETSDFNLDLFSIDFKFIFLANVSLECFAFSLDFTCIFLILIACNDVLFGGIFKRLKLQGLLLNLTRVACFPAMS